jgi:hypothetical protein
MQLALALSRSESAAVVPFHPHADDVWAADIALATALSESMTPIERQQEEQGNGDLRLQAVVADSRRHEGGGGGVTNPAAVVIAARRSGQDGEAMLRVLTKTMTFIAPKAKFALALCLPRPPAAAAAVTVAAAPSSVTVSVEAVGSGVVVVAALQVDQDATVGALRALVEKRAAAAAVHEAFPEGDAIRLFVGHGGNELACNEQRLSAAAVVDGATLVLVRCSSTREKSVLLSLFPGNRQLNWGASSTSAWDGVTCNSWGGVVAVDLSNTRLFGA